MIKVFYSIWEETGTNIRSFQSSGVQRIGDAIFLTENNYYTVMEISWQEDNGMFQPYIQLKG